MRLVWCAWSLVFLSIGANCWAEVTLELLIETNLNTPTFLTSPPGDDRLFVSERAGAIKIFQKDGQFIGTFVTVPGVSTSGEGGLLGVAFDPAYTSNGYFYVSYTGFDNGNFATIIERFSVSSDPNIAVATPAKRIIAIAQPDNNHNAGWIGFGPNDGYLYIPLGDGGGGHDIFDNGQELETLLGSILRLDVNAPVLEAYRIPADNPFVGQFGRDEIWAYGVRNPWRAGFDRHTGEFYFGDVGQNSWEEVNKGESGGNFGWPLREGFVPTPTGGVGGDLNERVDPIHVYANPAVGRSVVGGVVYRGAVTDLQGRYLFAEFYTRDIWALSLTDNSVTRLSDELPIGGRPIAFGEDNDGDVYVVTFSGAVYRFGGDMAVASAAVPMLPLGFCGLLIVLLSAAVFYRHRGR